MKLYSVNAGYFKLDGGAMFGVVPKSIWNRLNPADDNNMCSWAMRCLLIETGNRLILIDTGMGNKQDQKFFGYYYLHGDDSLAGSLAKHGFSPEDVTDVVLTHLHFDHCGGAIARDGDRLVPAFPNARFHTSEKHWNWAIEPNAREKASFLRENILPIQESGQLHFAVPGEELLPGLKLIEVNGHTESMLLPLIQHQDKSLLYLADLIPSSFHVPLPYIMGYDVRPLETLREKTELLNKAAAEGWTLFFEHDPQTECAQVEKTDKGVRVRETFLLQEF